MTSTSPSQPAPVQAVIFDLDGVLMDSEWLGFLAWQTWASLHGGCLPDSAFPGMVGMTIEDSARSVMKTTGLTFDVDESCAWAWQWVIDRVRVDPQPLPGAVELVHALAARGLPLAIASNSIARYVDDVLAGLGLLECFPIRVTVEQVAQGKPAPDVYLRAAALLSVDPTRSLAVEDSRVGTQAASAAGLRVIAVPGAHDQKSGFTTAWRIYPSLTCVVQDLDTLLK